jgi:hypothetical protein
VPLSSWIALVAGNILIAAMLIVMAYSVAYFGECSRPIGSSNTD